MTAVTSQQFSSKSDSHPSPGFVKVGFDDDDPSISLPSSPSTDFFVAHDVSSDEESASSVIDDVEEAESPSRRRNSRTRTVEVQSPLKHVASCERVRRNTDSLLEDALIAAKLKRRLGSRRGRTSGRTIEYSELSDFIMKSIMEGSLDAVSAAMPTDESLSNAANIAFHACMTGYFGHLEDEIVIQKLKHLFMGSLERVEFQQGSYICRQNEQIDKLFVVEEGMVQFSCGGQVAGNACSGAVLGELSLVYGIPAPSDIQCITPCAILWSMDSLSYRRIQAVVAKESLKLSIVDQETDAHRDNRFQILRRHHSSFLDLQEESNRSEKTDIPFDQLEKIAIIGKGAFGCVHVVKDKKSASSDAPTRYYSLKCMSKSSIIQHGNEKRVLIEKHSLQASLPSPFVIDLFGTYQDRDSIYFLTDFVQGGNLMGHMIQQEILPHEECVFFAANIVSGLIFLHSRGFVHRDVKPENCLIGKDGYLKLCDCGMAKRLPSTVQLPSGGTEVVTLAFTMCGTPQFMAPEFVLSTGYSNGIDWWALGCILVEMYCGRSPFEFDGDLKKTFQHVCLIGMGKETFTPPSELQETGLEYALDFVKQLLSKDSSRIGVRGNGKINEHRYFSGIDFDKMGRKQIKPPYLPKLLHDADPSYFDVRPEDQEETIDPFTGNPDVFKDF